jgi:hypothetical protein
MLGLRPELVLEPRPHRDNPANSDPRHFSSPYRAEFHGAWQRIDGYTDSPDQADAEQGAAYLAAIVPEWRGRWRNSTAARIWIIGSKTKLVA